MFFASFVLLLVLGSVSATQTCEFSNVTIATFTDALVDGVSQGLAVDGDYAFVTQVRTDSNHNRLTVVNLTDPTSLSIAGTVQDSTYLAAGLRKFALKASTPNPLGSECLATGVLGAISQDHPTTF